MREPKILFLLGLGILTVQIAAGQAEAEIESGALIQVISGLAPGDRLIRRVEWLRTPIK
jgi:hypothetical protein